MTTDGDDVAAALARLQGRFGAGGSTLRADLLRMLNEDPSATAADRLAGLRLLDALAAEARGIEAGVIEGAREAGVPWGVIARTLDMASPQSAQRRYQRLTGQLPGTPSNTTIGALVDRIATETGASVDAVAVEVGEIAAALGVRGDGEDPATPLTAYQARQIAGQVTAIPDL